MALGLVMMITFADTMSVSLAPAGEAEALGAFYFGGRGRAGGGLAVANYYIDS